MEGSASILILPTAQKRRMNSNRGTWVSLLRGKREQREDVEMGFVF